MFQQLTILLVTSDAAVKHRILRLTEQEQYLLSYAKDSAQAITTLKHTAIDLIICDTHIGQLDGWRLARMVRAQLFKCHKSTPFVLLTQTYCEHIAETTAIAFAIDKVVAKDKLDVLPEVLQQFERAKLPKPYVLSVLVVEDDPDIAELTCRILKSNYKVDIESTGAAGLARYKASTYDIVLLDVQLPEMSGAQVLHEIMRINPNQAVVIMTAHGGTDLAEQLMIEGAVDFVTKPFKAEQLRKVISIAAHRENYLISNKQFEEKVLTIKRSEDEYRQLSQTHERLLDHLATVVMELDLNGQIVFANRAWSALTGYSLEEVESEYLAPFAYCKAGRVQTLVNFHLKNIIGGQASSAEMEFELKHKSGRPIWVKAVFNNIEKNGQTVGVTASIDNIDDRKKAEIQLNHLASHDTLTDLYNRHYFDTQLNRLCDSSLHDGKVHTLLYIDLDHFKVVNDTQGHQQGDIILKEVAKSLTSFKREVDIICRIGGDEFAILLPNTNRDQAKRTAQNICDMLQQGHYKFGDRVYRISGSIGISEINGSESTPESYLQQADIALYVAKNRGRNLVHVFSKEDKDSEDFQVSVHWMHILRQAIIDDNLILHFQPVIHAKDKTIAYYEALVRLRIDEKLVMPNEFIPALERVEDIKLLDHQVISKAIYMMSVHKTLHKAAINLSAQAFSDERLLPLVKEKLTQYNVEPNRIIFEVTESASLTNLSATQSMIQALMELGCEFSIDDFGTGFSTFSYLKQLPANCVKIDGSFVKDMLKNPIDMALVKAICEVAKALNKTTVAEFVENEDTLIALRKLGVDYLQGYHISRPRDIHHLSSALFSELDEIV
jgi:diguanylate cyclase (GGDEF)-like protein/PAS domain S-box-containing protein